MWDQYRIAELMRIVILLHLPTLLQFLLIESLNADLLKVMSRVNKVREVNIYVTIMVTWL